MASALGDPYYSDEEPDRRPVPASVIQRALGALSGTPVPATVAPPPEPADAGPPVTLPAPITRGLSVLGGAPAVGGPPAAGEQAAPTPGLTPNVEGYRANVAPSAATSAIVAARDTGTEPVVEGQPSALGGAVKALTEVPPAATPAAPAVTPTPTPPEAPPESEKPAGPTPAELSKPTEAEPRRGAGSPGPSTSATTPRPPPPANEKLTIDPYYLVNLEKTNPALHDSIVQAATAAGISSGGLANLVYAVSQLSDKEKAGHMGLTGLTQEDIDNFKKNPITAPLFVGPDGQPTTTISPATNLLLGAQKYREMADKFGDRTPAAIIANYVGDGRTSIIGNMPSKEQQVTHVAQVTPEASKFVENATNGINAKPGAQMPTINPPGTNTAQLVTQAAMQAAQTGNVHVFGTVVANGAPRGSTPTDSWKHTEALMVAAQIAKGDMVGAQHARELVFQMSHVGATQSLMRGLQLMGTDGKGDLIGAAQEFAKAYWYMPDGFMTRIYVTDKGLMGERYQENTGQAVGGRFMITPGLVQGMINQARDPQTYLKTLRESLKLSADIDKTHAETKETLEGKLPHEQAQARLADAQAGYQSERAKIERDRMEALEETRLLEIQRKILANPKDAAAQEAERKHFEENQPRFFPEKDQLGNPIEPTVESTRGTQLWRDLLTTNRSTLEMSRAALLAKGIVNGSIQVGQYSGSDPRLAGTGSVLGKNGTPIGVVLSPTTMAFLRKQAPSPPLGAPAVAAPAR